jgi:hypothetical protein
MGAAGFNFREIRFIIKDEITHAYVLLEEWGDCPIGVQGWHTKSFPTSVPLMDILKTIGEDAILWPQQAPDQC